MTIAFVFCGCCFFLKKLFSFFFFFLFFFFFDFFLYFFFFSFHFSLHEKEKGVESRATHLPKKSRSRELPSAGKPRSPAPPAAPELVGRCAPRGPRARKRWLLWGPSWSKGSTVCLDPMDRRLSRTHTSTIFCHSNTTISLAMLNSTLTFQNHSNTTMSLAILAPTLPARLLQYPNVNSLASSPGRNNFRSRSQRIWCRTQMHAPGVNERVKGREERRADGTINMKVGEKPPLTALPIAFRKGSKTYKDALQHHVRTRPKL